MALAVNKQQLPNRQFNEASATAFGGFICIWGFQSLVFFGVDHDVLGTALGQCLDFLGWTMMF